MGSSAAEIDVKRCEALAAQAHAGDDRACRALVAELWPAWLELVQRSPTLARLAASDDHAHAIATRLAEKIGRPGGHGVRLYAPWRARHPDKDFGDWMRIVTANAVRDYVRARRNDAAEHLDPTPTRLLNELATSPLLEKLGVRPPFTVAQTARQLVEYAEARLPAAQARALALWLEGASFDDIARTLAIEDAAKVVHAAVAILRRHFRE